MYVAHVVPITGGISKEVLSYFTSEDIPPHSIVRVPLRGKIAFGLVLRTIDATEAKSQIKSSSFPLKKISGKSVPNFLLPEFLHAASATAEYYAATTGGIIDSLVPTRILEEYMKSGETFSLSSPVEKKNTRDVGENIKKENLHALLANDADRFSVYRSLLREEFAKGASVFVTTASIKGVEKMFAELSRGIEEYSFLFTGRLAGKELIKRWKEALAMDHSILVVGTPPFLSLPRRDYGLFILEEESSDVWRTFSRPFFDMRFFVEKFAEGLDAKIVLGDAILRSETFFRCEKGEISPIIPFRYRLGSGAHEELIDMKEAKPEARGGFPARPNEKSSKDTFRIIGRKLEVSIKNTIAAGGNVFLFNVRRGLYPVTVCRDCGHIVSCSRCSAPAVIHAGDGENIFLCHKCGEKRSAKEVCRACRSWRLLPRGIGVEQAAIEVAKLFPEAKIFQLHKESAPTESAAETIAKKFGESKGAILLGTERAVPYIKDVSVSAVLSVDPLFSLPDFRIGEKILRLFFEIKNRTEREFFIQTRRADEKFFEFVANGNLLDFYRGEIAAREKFRYPPFATLVKISFGAGEEEGISEKTEYLRKLLTPATISVFPAFTQKIKGRIEMRALIRIHPDDWPHQGILRALASLPPEFTVMVDPEELL